MKKHIAFLGVIAFTAIALIVGFSCRKKTEPIPTPTSYTSNIDDFFTSNATPAVTFTISATTNQTITGTRALVIVPANAFVTKATGSPITGTVEITLKEIYSKKDMILNKAQTATLTDLLSSAGELDIKAKQGTVDLKLAPSKQLSIKILELSTPQSGMTLFYGATNTNQQLIWTLSTNATSIIPTPDTTALGAGYCYNFNCDSLGLINCDAFFNSNPRTSFTVNVTGNHNKTNTTVFVAFQTLNGVIHLAATISPGQIYSSPSLLVPVGVNVIIIAISEINGQYYSAFVPATITTGFNTTITLTPTTNSAILTQLNSL